MLYYFTIIRYNKYRPSIVIKMKDLNLELTKYVVLDNQLLILPSSVAKLKGYKGNNYSNWATNKHSDLLLGKEVRLIRDSLLWLEAIRLFKAKYNVLIATSEDVRLIDIERATAYFNTAKPQHTIHPSLSKKNSHLILPMQEPTITSIEFATQLGIEHRAVKQLINKYKSRLESLGPVTLDVSPAEKTLDGKWAPKEVPDYYKLTENQCYFLGALSRNTEQVVDFKLWIVTTFAALKNERVIDGPMKELLSYFPGNWEGLIQTLLCHLSSFTKQPFRQEVKLNNKSRVDILMSDTEALEIKNHIITPCHVKNLIINKAYWFQLKEQLPKFEILYLTSTKGITDQAISILEPLRPEIQYISLSSLFQRVAPNKDLPLHLLPS